MYHKLTITRRNLPHWLVSGSMYFVTFRTAKGILSEDERGIVLRHLRQGDRQFYDLAAAVVMPDHVHLLIKPIPPFELPRIMKGIKGVSARLIHRSRNVNGSLWQDESWDRIVRDSEEFFEKLNYLANNPVKAGLVATPEEYAYWHCHQEMIP